MKDKDKGLIGSARPQPIPDWMLPKVAKILGYRRRPLKRNMVRVTEIDSTLREDLPVLVNPCKNEQGWEIAVEFYCGSRGTSPKKTLVLGFIHEDDLPLLGVLTPRDKSLNLAHVSTWQPKCVKGQKVIEKWMNDPDTQKLLKELKASPLYKK